jgi:hypothetical protein
MIPATATAKSSPTTRARGVAKSAMARGFHRRQTPLAAVNATAIAAIAGYTLSALAIDHCR